jgi:Nucleotidyl transferase AbiEii toxin, Type IV TA system
VLPGGPFEPAAIDPLLLRTLGRIHDAAGIMFSARPPALRLRPDGLSTEGRVYYIGPRQTPAPARVKLDISANETVVRPPVLREIGHPYPDSLPQPGRARCYSFEEIFAEKLRAMAQRGRPRDLYDIVNLFRRNDLRLYPGQIRAALAEKCAVKNIPVPTAADFADSPSLAELESEWANMLGHQLPALPPLASFLEELPTLFGWLDGSIVFEELPPTPYAANENEDWSPPATVATWRTGIPLEAVRFAATNHLLVELRYHGSVRLIEPYSLRQSRAGRLLLHAERADGGGHRTYGVDTIEAIRVSTIPFRPRMPIEFSARGPMHAPLQSRSTRGYYRTPPRTARRMTGPMHIYQCNYCGREFPHIRRNATLARHKTRDGAACPGRRGTYLGVRY